jgi:translation initiation factor IF-2
LQQNSALLLSTSQVAEAFKAVIYAFNVDCPLSLVAEAKKKNIAIKKHNIIYKLVDDVKEEITLRIPKRQEEEIVGKYLLVP